MRLSCVLETLIVLLSPKTELLHLDKTSTLSPFVVLSWKNNRSLSVTGLLEKFHPAARQLLTAGKLYLKALHGESTLL
ncbi:hypothetical protein FHG87_010605 [Trinorchestia longiramus]|nr:hypothetical protein FHG87_010605 [Trinorchestia longiramus]